jgi:hypothetical protein
VTLNGHWAMLPSGIENRAPVRYPSGFKPARSARGAAPEWRQRQFFAESLSGQSFAPAFRNNEFLAP